MTRRISAVAVCCSSASRSSVNRRTFSMAITAWAAKVSSSAICCGVKGPGSVRAGLRPNGRSFPQQRRRKDGAKAKLLCECGGRRTRPDRALRCPGCEWSALEYAVPKAVCRSSGRRMTWRCPQRASWAALRPVPSRMWMFASSPRRSELQPLRPHRTPAARRSANWR